MSVHKKTSTVVVARHLKIYKTGDKVRVVRGKLAGQVLTIFQTSNDWVMLLEMARREVMSKGNVEPEGGFSEDEMNHARRVSEKMSGLGSLM